MGSTSFLAVLIVSALSLVGVLFLGPDTRRKIILNLLALTAGVLAADAFLHLIPEAVEELPDPASVGIFLLVGVGMFFALEHWLHMHHERHSHAPDTLGYLNVVGDGFHNFIDGILIAAAFAASRETGLAVTIAIILHELPQEFGDFALLLHSGFTKRRAVLLNFVSALCAVLGWVVMYAFSRYIDVAAGLPAILAVTAGGFLYISGAGIFPELKEESGGKLSWANIFSITTGVALMFALTFIES